MEDYLKTDYAMIELDTYEDISEYAKDEGRDLFDCGQGYYQDEVTFYCKVGDGYFLVDIKAEIDSQKQDRGDRLYWVDKVSDVQIKEILKPLPTPRIRVAYVLVLTEGQRAKTLEFLKENNVSIDQEVVYE